MQVMSNSFIERPAVVVVLTASDAVVAVIVLTASASETEVKMISVVAGICLFFLLEVPMAIS